MSNAGLKASLEDAKCTLEELQEDGCLEDVFKASQDVAELERLLGEKEAAGVEARWLPCGLCGGSGKHRDYEDSWPCPPCSGRGGTWI